MIEFLLELHHSVFTLVSKILCTTGVFQMIVLFSHLHIFDSFLCNFCYVLDLYFYMINNTNNCLLTTIVVCRNKIIEQIALQWRANHDKSGTIEYKGKNIL